MFEFHEKRKLRSVIYSKGTIVVLCAAVLFISVAAWSAYTKERDTRIRKNEQQANFNELYLREEELRNEIGRLKTSEGIEAEVRDKYDVKLPGEELIVIIEPEEIEDDRIEGKNKSLMQKLLEIFI